MLNFLVTSLKCVLLTKLSNNDSHIIFWFELFSVFLKEFIILLDKSVCVYIYIYE